MLLSTIVGLYNYPYYDLVLNGPVNQIEKLPKVLAFCHAHGFNVDGKQLMQVWIIARQLKGVLMEAFWCFGGAYVIYCWYKDDWKQGFEILIKAVLASVLLLVLYAGLEVTYLGGSTFAAGVLSKINPYIHTIVAYHGWWPPLLWKGQLRLVFPEPSNVGNYMALAIPVLWYKLFSCKDSINKLILIAIIVMSFLIFLTKARTAYAMYFGMIGLLLLLIIVSKEYQWLKKYCAVIICAMIGFGAFVQFTSYTALSQTKDVKVEKYITYESETKIAKAAIQNNFTSLASDNKRSNGARYALLKSGLRIAAEHPILGVGNGLLAAYIVDHYTPAEKMNKEVNMWVTNQQKYGPFSLYYTMNSTLNEYVNRLAKNGIIGLLVFLIPFIYVCSKLAFAIRQSQKYKSEALFILLILTSLIVAGCNDSINMFYSIWIILGLAYAFINTKRTGE